MTDMIAWGTFFIQLLSLILNSLKGGAEWRSLL
jgi:hypothetical protein